MPVCRQSWVNLLAASHSLPPFIWTLVVPKWGKYSRFVTNRWGAVDWILSQRKVQWQCQLSSSVLTEILLRCTLSFLSFWIKWSAGTANPPITLARMSDVLHLCIIVKSFSTCLIEHTNHLSVTGLSIIGLQPKSELKFFNWFERRESGLTSSSKLLPVVLWLICQLLGSVFSLQRSLQAACCWRDESYEPSRQTSPSWKGKILKWWLHDTHLTSVSRMCVLWHTCRIK